MDILNNFASEHSNLNSTSHIIFATFVVKIRLYNLIIPLSGKV